MENIKRRRTGQKKEKYERMIKWWSLPKGWENLEREKHTNDDFFLYKLKKSYIESIDKDDELELKICNVESYVICFY